MHCITKIVKFVLTKDPLKRRLLPHNRVVLSPTKCAQGTAERTLEASFLILTSYESDC